MIKTRPFLFFKIQRTAHLAGCFFKEVKESEPKVKVREAAGIPGSGDSCFCLTRALARTPQGKRELLVLKLFCQRVELSGMYPKGVKISPADVKRRP